MRPAASALLRRNAAPNFAVARRMMCTAPLVSDILVNVTFVDFKGERTTVPGLVGDSLSVFSRTAGAFEHHTPSRSDSFVAAAAGRALL